MTRPSQAGIAEPHPKRLEHPTGMHELVFILTRKETEVGTEPASAHYVGSEVLQCLRRQRLFVVRQSDKIRG